MKPQTLSKSPINDPFAKAQAQHESRQTLSQSPIQPQGSPMDAPNVSSNPEFDSLPNNEAGRMQLINMLMAKYGDTFQQNPEAMKMMSDFDMKMNSPENMKSINQGLANANRTLAALFGGG